MYRPLPLARGRTGWTLPLLCLACAGLLAGGTLGTLRYVGNYWLYRGFDPPRDPSYVRALGDVGSTQRFYIESPALGGRRQPVDVYLPPGYAAHRQERYPVFYLLHGFLVRPAASFRRFGWAVSEATLL